MCFFGGGGGGAPQVVYRDNPNPVVSPPATLPPPMNTNPVASAEGDSTKSNLGTSVFKINKNPYVPTNDYYDQGIDNGVQYLG